MISPGCSGTVTRPPRVRVLELGMGTPLDNDHPAQSAESLHYLSTGYAWEGWHRGDSTRQV